MVLFLIEPGMVRFAEIGSSVAADDARLGNGLDLLFDSEG
jgi:hypothetical protein